MRTKNYLAAQVPFSCFFLMGSFNYPVIVVCFRLCNTGFGIRQGSAEQEPRVPVSPSLLIEYMVAVYFAMWVLTIMAKLIWVVDTGPNYWIFNIRPKFIEFLTLGSNSIDLLTLSPSSRKRLWINICYPQIVIDNIFTSKYQIISVGQKSKFLHKNQQGMKVCEENCRQLCFI